ncbi:MAG: 4Fe-4S dicluster domain-containing protein [Synergistaceae bacterium]|jgi:heterodisulfide reductase subunit C|nr:4Fe-4S dicluster domain-containing protein [Synergistaceae bacterium]
MHADEQRQTETIIRTSGVNVRKCMKCGKCSATCPNFAEMDIHPHRFVSMVEEGDVAALMRSKSLWRCLSCFACVERCPRGVEPAHLIEAVRMEVIRPQGGNRLRPEAVPALLDEKIPQQLIVSAFRKYSK